MSTESPPTIGRESAAPEQELAEESWWSRPCGGREVLAIALPLVISTMSWTIMNFVDRMMLLWHSQDEMAAAAPAGFLMFSWICLPLGTAAYANTFVAQYVGSGNPKRVGVAVWQAVLLACIAAPLFTLTIPFARWMFALGNHPAAVQGFELDYYRIVSLGGGATVAAAALSTFFTGRGNTQTVMVVDGIAAIVNAGIDYVLIFGHLGFPELGVEGAAAATAISQWGKVAVYFGLMMQRKHEAEYGVRSGMRFDGRIFGRLLYFGGPEGLRMLSEMIGLTGFMILVGRLGGAALAATTMAFNINGVGFIPLVGMGIAVSTLVGQQLGKDRVDLATRATFTALWISFAYTIVTAVFYLGFPELILSAHERGADATEFAELQRTTTALLRFVAAYCLADVCYIIFLGAIRGAGDSRFVLVASFLLSPFPLIGTWIGLRYLGWGLYGCWTVLTIWVTLNSLIYTFRFLQGRWKTMRVIEPELL